MPTLDDLRAVRPIAAARASRPPLRFRRPQRAREFIPVVATGGIGDLVISLGVCQQICRRTRFPIRLWCPQPALARFLLEDGPRGIQVEDSPFPGFDWSIRVNCLASFEFGPNFRGFPEIPELERMHLVSMGFTRAPEWKQVFAYHPRLDYRAGELAMARGWRRHELPFRILGLEPQSIEPFRSQGPYDWEPFITVHDGFDATQRAPLRGTKTWNIRHWGGLTEMLRAQYPRVLIVQLGGPTSRQIPGVDISLVGKSLIEESLKVLSRSLCHIDGDSGLVHAAHVYGVRSVAMFGPTPAKFFGYPENENLEPEECGGCWWLTDEWNGDCPREFRIPRCMDSIDAQRVFTHVQKIMETA